MRLRLALLSLAAALLSGCATVENPVTGREERTVMDEPTELAEGRREHEQVLAEYGALRDARLQAYVDGIGQRLAKNSHRPGIPWTFTVLDSPEVNAFALPGGYVYITRGIMAYLDNEAELAGVIGHEIGHVTARHGAQRATRQQTAGLGVLAATVLGALLESQGVTGAGELSAQVSQVVAAGYIAKYSREQETQADGLGAEYLARTRYDPSHMVDVIQVLKDQERFAAELAKAEGRAAPTGADWLASHPSNEQRLRDIKQVAARYAGQYGDDARTRYLQAVDGLAFGESREQGVTRGRHFFHEPLGIAFTAPQGWRIQNAADTLRLVAGAGDAGLVVHALPSKAGSTHDDILRQVIEPDRGRVERYTINGHAATHFTGTRKNDAGRAEDVEVTVVTGPGSRHFLFVYAARDAQALQRERNGLREAEASFRALSAAERAAAKPWVLHTVAFPRAGFAMLARQSPLPNLAEQRLRLINGVYGGGEPAPGQIVKVVDD